MKKLNLSEKSDSLDLAKQREILLELNTDSIYGVYELIENSNGKITLKMVGDIMTVYKNQWDNGNIKIPENCKSIKILDLGELRKGNLVFLSGEKNSYNQDKKYLLLSGGTIEYIKGKSGKTHIITTLRDSGASDKLERTTTGGRNVGSDLIGEIERENFEESPFLVKNKNGEYFLCIAFGNENGKNYTKQSIIWWLKNKYNLSRKTPGDLEFIKKFEKIFNGIKYEELGNILKNILKNDNFIYYNWQENNIKGVESSIKELELDGKGLSCFVFFDEKNNTIEYRSIREISFTQKGYKFVGLRPSRLYLESQNQVPKIHNLGVKFNDKLVPLVSEIVKLFEKTLKNK